MMRELSTRSLVLIATGLAVASALFCWRWATRCAATVQRYECEIALMESKQDELEYQILNAAALLLRASEEPSRAGRLVPSDPRFLLRCDIAASRTLRCIESVRADAFLLWYYDKMKVLHFGNELRKRDLH